jgi:hypothetical protein
VTQEILPDGSRRIAPYWDKYKAAQTAFLSTLTALGFDPDSEDEPTTSLTLTVEQHRRFVEALDDFLGVTIPQALALDVQLIDSLYENL